MKKKSQVLLLTMTIILMIIVSVLALSAENVDDEFLWYRVRVQDSVIELEGDWRLITNSLGDREQITSFYVNTSAEFKFEGSAIRWKASKSPMRGKADVYINGVFDMTVDLYAAEEKLGEIVYVKEGLPEKEHTITIVPKGEKNTQAFSSHISINELEYIPTLANIVEAAEMLLAQSPEVPKKEGDLLVAYYEEDAVLALNSALEKGLELIKQDLTREKLLNEIANINIAIKEYDEAMKKPVFPDLSKNDYKAIVVSGSPEWVEGINGKAVLINSEDLIRVNDFTNLNRENHTIEFRLQLPEPVSSGWLQLFGIKADGNDRSPGIWTSAGSPFQLHYRYNPGNQGFWNIGLEGEGEGPLEKDTWYDVAGVKRGDSLEIYINGAYIESINVPEESEQANFIDIGTSRNVVFDEIRIWNIARTAEEIKGNENEKLTGKEEGLIAYWDFNTLK